MTNQAAPPASQPQPGEPPAATPASQKQPASPDQPASPNQPTVPSPPPADEQARVEAAAARTGGARSAASRLADAGVTRNLGLVAALVILAIVGVVSADTFATTSNLLTVLKNASVIGVVTVGMTFVIMGGGIDLSVGSLIALASVWSTTVATQSYGASGVWFCAILVGTITGLVNGVLIAYGRMVAFIVTLAMLVGARGVAQYMSDQQTQVVKVEAINNIASDTVLGIPILVIIMVLVFAAGWVLLNLTTFGRRTVAIGGNAEAARLAGIDVRRHTLLLYGLSGLCCGIAAVMLSAQANSGSSTNGEFYELDAIAAVIIGGTLLTGGRGTLVGTFLGVMVFTLITNLFILNNLATPIQNIAKGAIIVAAVLLQRRSKEAAT